MMMALAGGQDSALNEIIDRWQTPITSFLYRMVGDFETAVDLSQDVFVRLYKSRKSYKASDRFSSYIFTIATNLGKNHFRWKMRHPESRLDDDYGFEQAGSDVTHTNPCQYMEQSEQALKVRQAIQSLPEKHRIPVILFYYQELPQAEIAEILKCSEKSIENRLYRARKRLKSIMEEPDEQREKQAA